MSARTAPGLAALALLSAGAVQAADTVAAPTIRAVSTPAGQMLVLDVPQSPAAAAAAATASTRKPDTDVQMTSAGPMLVLRGPAATPNALTATANARVAAATTSSIPANARAEALPNGEQMLVLPSAVPVAPLTVQRAVVEIDPAKVGTRTVDTPRSDVLYRPKVEPAPAAAATR